MNKWVVEGEADRVRWLGVRTNCLFITVPGQQPARGACEAWLGGSDMWLLDEQVEQVRTRCWAAGARRVKIRCVKRASKWCTSGPIMRIYYGPIRTRVQHAIKIRRGEGAFGPARGRVAGWGGGGVNFEPMGWG